MGQHEEEQLSVPMAVVSMVNGMIGGLILLLPVYSLEAGYILTLIVIFVTCLFSYYSCYLCLIHMGKSPDLDQAILCHFNGNKYAKIFYDICVWTNLIFLALLYFQLIGIQWVGLIPPHQYSWINPVINAIVLVAMVFLLKYFELGASLMAYGIISIITYLLFLLWAVITYDQGYTGSQLKPFSGGAVNMAAAMGQAFTIQAFFIPIIKKAPNPSKYTLYVLVAYIIGGLSYYYIAYAGSFSIWKRECYGQPGEQATIEDYFPQGNWEVNIIEGIYLVHLYSVFPQFLLISKKRMFHVIGLEESQRGKVKLTELIYVVLVVGVCLAAGMADVDVSDLIDINGAVVGFFFIYLIPAVLHIKCLYFSRGKRPLPQKQHLEILSVNTLSLEDEYRQDKEKIKKQADIEITSSALNNNKSNSINRPLLEESSSRQNGDSRVRAGSEANSQLAAIQYAEQSHAHFYCNVDLETYSKGVLILDWTFIVVMVGLGLFIMVNGIYTVAK